MKKVLLIAFNFPPQAGSSGLLRGLKFCRHLPESGWLPVVLTAHPRAYEYLDFTQLSEIPPDVSVVRAFAMDTRKQLSWHGRYFRAMAVPDRWISWSIGAIPAGLAAIHRYRVDVILSTFPIATAVLNGLILHLITGRPWVVDFRDPMVADDYLPGRMTRGFLCWLEEQAVRRSSLLTFTAHSTVQVYLRRYPWLRPEKCVLIPNGYDEEDFRDLPGAGVRTQGAKAHIRLLHLGLLDPEARSPAAFFRALARLKKEGAVNASNLRVDLRAAGAEDFYARLICDTGIEDLAYLLPLIPYREALRDGGEADGLLLFQGAQYNRQIPTKTYEYLRLRRPILALTTAEGDTAALLRNTGGATLVEMNDEEAIYRTLPGFLELLRAGQYPLPDAEKVRQYSRRSQTAELAKCLSKLAVEREGG